MKKNQETRRKTNIFTIVAVFLCLMMMLSFSVSNFVFATETCEHEWSEWTVTKEATYFAKGTMQRTCYLCGKVENQTVKKLVGESVWAEKNGNKYYFTVYGDLATGWKKIKISNDEDAEVKWCYFNKKNIFKKSVSLDTNKKWIKVDGKKYYCVNDHKPVLAGKCYYDYMYGTYILVDLSDQNFKFYKNGVKKLSGRVITGKKSTPTPKGVYKINNKMRNARLKGKAKKTDGTDEEWDREVKYWMSFIGSSYGFHDASWQYDSYFNNKKSYIYHGSHGCINLRERDARNLYKKVAVGTYVIIKK